MNKRSDAVAEDALERDPREPIHDRRRSLQIIMYDDEHAMLQSICDKFHLASTVVVRQLIRNYYDEHFPGVAPRYPTAFVRHLGKGHAKRGSLAGTTKAAPKATVVAPPPRAPGERLATVLCQACVAMLYGANVPEGTRPEENPDESCTRCAASKDERPLSRVPVG